MTWLTKYDFSSITIKGFYVKDESGSLKSNELWQFSYVKVRQILNKQDFERNLAQFFIFHSIFACKL